jgi:hypothetical protein
VDLGISPGELHSILRIVSGARHVARWRACHSECGGTCSRRRIRSVRVPLVPAHGTSDGASLNVKLHILGGGTARCDRDGFIILLIMLL